MSEKVVKIKTAEIKRVYQLVKELHNFFHQPMNYVNVEEFAEEHYDEIRDVYYDVLWEWLPAKMKAEFEKE